MLSWQSTLIQHLVDSIYDRFLWDMFVYFHNFDATFILPHSWATNRETRPSVQ